MASVRWCCWRGQYIVVVGGGCLGFRELGGGCCYRVQQRRRRRRQRRSSHHRRQSAASISLPALCTAHTRLYTRSPIHDDIRRRLPRASHTVYHPAPPPPIHSRDGRRRRRPGLVCRRHSTNARTPPHTHIHTRITCSDVDAAAAAAAATMTTVALGSAVYLQQ